jgi:hypothetical protein
MTSEKDKIARETLLEEIHVVDNLLETHANIMIVLISAMFFFIFKIESTTAKYILSALGFAVSLEFFLHIYRLKDIAKSATKRLKRIEKRMGIDTARKPTLVRIKTKLGVWKIKIPTGSTFILYISLVFMSFWLILIGLLSIGKI